MVEDFLKNGGYEIQKSEDNSNPFIKINIKEQEIDDDPEDFFNDGKHADEEKDVIYLENVDDSEADTNSEDKDCEEDEHIFFFIPGPKRLHTLYFNCQHLKDYMAVHGKVTFPAVFVLRCLSRLVLH